ncbi:GNAT family N-acetyltransferase [Cereibacter sediminicola]|uniref:GNAT family N-acetyltransferase n=1 Tax=Cereibacter sediminicola TaxID=2584941 RepID=UPI0011A9CF41|nr:GNAT family N-acetyltransferase [Cereibacter sediminicola]
MIAVTGSPAITTERLTLRMPAARDWEPVAGFLTSDRVRFIGGTLTRDKAWRAFGHMVGHWVLRGYGMFIFTLRGSDEALGMAGPWYPEGWPEQEIGWSVFSEAGEGQGYAREAAEAARRHAFQNLGWKTAVSYIHPHNVRSLALAERLGAVRDEGASFPGDGPALVFRHPGSEARG